MRKLLVVDDEKEIVDVIQRVLGESGYEVVSTTSPVGALSRVEAGERFDLAVLDVVMPDLSGDILAARLRQHDPDLPVLFVTGYDEALFQARPLLWYRESLLEKPFTAAALREAVSMAIWGSTSPPPRAS